MSREFNYARAHREWAQPAFDNLSAQIKLLFQMVVRASPDLQQGKDLNIAWPEDGVLQNEFAQVDPEELVRAAFVVYRWGHWAHMSAVTVKYPGMKPKRFEADDFNPFGPMTQAKAWVKTLNAYPPFVPDDQVEYEKHYAGPDNSSTCGAYWKFEKLAKNSAIERGLHGPSRGVTEDRIAKELGFNQEDFMDHKPGSKWTNDEKHILFREPLGDMFEPRKVDAVNHRPHPFCIGTKHMEAAQKYGGILGEEACRAAPCAMQTESYPRRMCGLSYDEHTHDTVLFLKQKRNLDHEEVVAKLQSLEPMMKEHGIDGFAFIKTEFEISDPMWMVMVRCTTDVPREQWDFDDQQGNPVGEYTFTPRAKNEEEARERALDEFHSTVPIALLETFDIEAEVLPRDQTSEAPSEPV